MKSLNQPLLEKDDFQKWMNITTISLLNNVIKPIGLAMAAKRMTAALDLTTNQPARNTAGVTPMSGVAPTLNQHYNPNYPHIPTTLRPEIVWLGIPPEALLEQFDPINELNHVLAKHPKGLKDILDRFSAELYSYLNGETKKKKAS